jgi:mono/diheme cytochrome c family protein
MKIAIIIIALALAATTVIAAEQRIALKEGQGRDKIEANCGGCHSLDYIPMNSVFLDRKGWDASVNKMIKVMGAPIPEQDIPALVDYLTRNYGKP